MPAKLITVRFYGSLAEDLGRPEWALAVKSPAEALQAIEVNTGRMIESLYKNAKECYFVVINGKPVKAFEEMTVMHRSDLESIEFIPTYMGAGSGSSLWMMVAGVMLIALVLLTPGTGPLATVMSAKLGAAAGAATIGAVVAGVGVSLLFAGFAGLLAPTPKTNQTERPENQPSYIFNGAVNTYRQGNPIPVGFGRMIVGSQIVAAGVRTIDVDVRN